MVQDEPGMMGHSTHVTRAPRKSSLDVNKIEKHKIIAHLPDEAINHVEGHEDKIRINP
jgi:hypothetical protein